MDENLELTVVPFTQSSHSSYYEPKCQEINLDNILSQNLPESLNSFDGIFIKNTPNFQNVIEVLQKRFFVRFFNRQSSTFILKFDITDLESINPSEVQKLMEKFNKKIFIISFENSNNEEVQIFWKFRDEKIFWTRIQKEISKFFLIFLASSMRNDGHCGISADFLSTLQSTEKIFEVDKVALTNSNGLTLLMIAAERGDSNAVDFLLKLGFNVNQKVDEKTAVDLAWDNQHFEVVLQLLKANSYFPRNFEVNLATVGIKEFIDVTMELQNFILDGNFEEIERILNKNPNLRHFNSIQNISAPAFALLNGKFDAYEFLVANNVYIGPDEKLQEILKQVDRKGSENLNEIHQKYLKNFKENHLMILTVNSFVGHDVPNADEKLSHVRKAFKFLDQVDPFVSLILQTVAASRNFRIIFDFDKKMEHYVDLTAEQRRRNMLFSTKQIHIPAADLLNPNMAFDVYGMLAHDLCLFAMQLVYRNFARPYYSHEHQARKLFSKISAVCMAARHKEEMINSVYYYPPDMHHSELIAQFCYMIVKYSKIFFKMEECRVNFPDLYKFCDEVITLDMQAKIPLIQNNIKDPLLDVKVSSSFFNPKKLIFILAIPFIIWLAIPKLGLSDDRIYSCGNLTDELRDKIFESTVDFQGVNVIFGDLFGRNSSACEHLSPQDSTKMLKVFDSGKYVENYTGIYRNFTDEENQRIASKVNPKWEIGYKKIVDENLDQSIYEAKNQNDEGNVYIKYMKMKFRVPSLKIHQKVKTRTKFYVERILKLPNPSSDSNSGIPLGFNRITKMKLLLLSDKGGSGKSTYFRHMAWKLKRRFPLKWISYVDLKQHIDILQNAPKSDANLTTLVDFLSSKILNLTSKVEIEVFERRFLSNDSIFFWDGVDEVSPKFTNEVLRLIEIVSELTDNKQWMAARPHLEDDITYNLEVEAYNFENFNEDDKKEFVGKFMESEGVKNLNISRVLEEMESFSRNIKKSLKDAHKDDDIWVHFNGNLQVFEIICESYLGNVLFDRKLNLYSIYEEYFHKILSETYREAHKSIKDPIWYQKLTKTLQHYAIVPVVKHHIHYIYDEEDADCRELEIYNSSKISNSEEILRLGIVHMKNDEIIFEDKISENFFIAQYLFQNIWNSTAENLDEAEADRILQLLFYIFFASSSSYKIVTEHVNGFIENYVEQTNSAFSHVFKDLIHTKYSNLLLSLTSFASQPARGIELAIKFFKKDTKLIKFLWKVDANRTLFHRFLEITTKAAPVNSLKKIVVENFSQEDRKKIFEGKYQAANFLSILWANRFNESNTAAIINATNYSYDIEKLKSITNFENFMEFMLQQKFSKEEIREFFYGNVDIMLDINKMKIYEEYGQKLLSKEEYEEVVRIRNIRDYVNDFAA